MSEEKSDKWVMPEPIFRQSTGETVNPADRGPMDPEPDTLEPHEDPEADILELHEDPEPDTLVPENPLANLYSPPDADAEFDVTPATQPTAASGIEIEPQPMLSEETTAERIIVETANPKPKRSVRPVLLAVFLVILLGAVVGIGLAVYFYISPDAPTPVDLELDGGN